MNRVLSRGSATTDSIGKVTPRTVEEFEAQYAQRSGVTIEWLHTHGRYGAPCDCDYEGCEGFQMEHRDV